MACLLVARGGVTKFPVAQRAQSELKASNVLGFVLNAVHETAPGRQLLRIRVRIRHDAEGSKTGAI